MIRERKNKNNWWSWIKRWIYVSTSIDFVRSSRVVSFLTGKETFLVEIVCVPNLTNEQKEVLGERVSGYRKLKSRVRLYESDPHLEDTHVWTEKVYWCGTLQREVVYY